MSRAIVNQEASVNLPVRAERDFRRFSMSSIRSPVSMALELATALRMLARGTDTLPVLFLRTMGRLRNKMTGEIIALVRHTVASRDGKQPARRVEPNDWLEAEIKQNLGGLGYAL